MAKEGQYLRGDEEVDSAARGAAIRFDQGTLVVEGLEEAEAPKGCGLRFDPRVGHHRAPADAYRLLVGALVRGGWTVVDHARGYEELELQPTARRVPYDHQAGAIEAWTSGGKRGVVVLPTGAGKTFVAQMAIERVGRSALVVVPTLDLVDQWSRVLAEHFGLGADDVGMLGGGQHEVRDLTVSTYDSAALHMDRLGGRFGLVVFDEVHHLPGDLYRQAAEAAIAPFRLGLTATFERADGKHVDITELVGPVVYERSIKELSGDILADYRVETIEVPMTPEDLEAYTRERGLYRGFVESQNVRLGGRNGWRNFLAATSRSEEGRRALQAYQTQKQIALAHDAKLDVVAELLARHVDDRTIVFTNDNDSVFRISERLLVPSITHQTPVKERGEILEKFAAGTYRALATSKVLNEGVDVPEASVAIILSGTGSVREHVQRLGRILRRGDDKKAILYELVTADSVETFVSQRRREHDAYR